ncbi:MAG: histone deacetylase [Candidatus Krumholzibacteria bacterium]|nr:histone deacetylase [Candidatus Krumholzibacteria bacterium]
MNVKEDGATLHGMLKTAYVIDARFQDHIASPNHPERPERLGALLEMMKRYRREGLVKTEPRFASREELLSNHDRALVDEVAATAGRERHVFDTDTQASAASYETARLAVGGLLAIVDAIMGGKANNGFALVRPPGHHAEADRAMGFCFFNTVAIAARYLLQRYGIEKVLVVDWDVHHGNGTQRSFYAMSSVLYMSTHQYPHYPGTGALSDVGVADGLGYTVNLPFPAGFGDAEYALAFRRIVEPIGHEFKPEFVLISAGFDCHELDPLGDMHVTAEGFSAMTQALLTIAGEHAEGRCAAVLEGGYSVEALKDGVATVLGQMGGRRDAGKSPEPSAANAVIESIRKAHKRFWKI